MPYVKCPSCEGVSYTAAAYAALECCPQCGGALPRRRAVVPLAVYRRSVRERAQGAVWASAPSRWAR